jgi:Fe-S cluster assembly iron-binding protein IscA
MLSLTDSATTAIRTLIDRPEMPDGSGLRLATAEDGSGSFSVSAAAAPQPGDSVIETDGARVFLEPDAADLLDEKVLDAGTDNDGHLQFLLAAP